MGKIYYYVSNLLAVFNIHNGAIASAIIKDKVQGKGTIHFKDNYKHNFWTEVRGGRRIDTFEVFKSKYTYLDN